MGMKDNMTIAVLVILYVGILYMYVGKVKAFKRFSEKALLKVESKHFFYSKKLHNLSTSLIILLFLIQLVFEVQRGRALFGTIVFSILLVIVLVVHFKSTAASVWLIMQDGIVVYGEKEVIPWTAIDKFSWNMKDSNKCYEVYLFSKGSKKANQKVRLLIDKDISKDAQKLLKKYAS